MSLSLTVADNQDGSGATATVSGSSGGAVVVYYQADPGRQLLAGGSRTGDGTVALSIPPGYYLGIAQVNGGGISSIVRFVVTREALAVHEQCIQALKQKILLLDLKGFPAGRVYDQILPNDKLVDFPCIMLSIEGETEPEAGSLAELCDLQYPVRVWINTRADASTPANRAQYLMWRQQIFRALENQRLPGADQPEIIGVRMMPIIDVKLPAVALIVMGMTVTCISRFRGGVD